MRRLVVPFEQDFQFAKERGQGYLLLVLREAERLENLINDVGDEHDELVAIF